MSGKLAASTCGDGALGAKDIWNFQVKLTRFENDIYWLNGQETLVGDIANDGRTFSIESGVQVKVSDPGRGQRGCVINRRDEARGKLSDSGSEVEGFEGSLAFSYEAAKRRATAPTGSGPKARWTGSPAPSSYDLSGTRSGATK